MYYHEIVEYVARKWSEKKPASRYVIRPSGSPTEPFLSIKEAIIRSEHFKAVKFICKIDDDIIALKKNWIVALQNEYVNLSKNSDLGFITGLINNNCWGFIFTTKWKNTNRFIFIKLLQVGKDPEL